MELHCKILNNNKILFKDLLNDAIDSKTILVPGIGMMTGNQLKSNVIRKIEDMLSRAKKGDFLGIGKRQFDLVAHLWDTLQKLDKK